MSETPIFQISSDTKTLASVLAELEVGQMVEYAALSRAIGRDVMTVARQSMDSARRLLQRERRMVFGCVMGKGLKRLNSTEIVDSSDAARQHIRRTATRQVRKLECVDYDSLSKEKQTKHNVAMAALGVVAELSAEKSVRRLEHSVSSGTQLTVAKAAIEALGLTETK